MARPIGEKSTDHFGGGECGLQSNQPAKRKGDLNFGWFSLPLDDRGKEKPSSRGRGDNGQIPQSPNIHQPLESITEDGQHDQTGQRPISAGKEAMSPPLSRSGRASKQLKEADVEHIVQDDLTEQSDVGCSESERVGDPQCEGAVGGHFPPESLDYGNRPRTTGNFTMDWPLSRTAQELMLASRRSTQKSETPPPRSAQARAVPPTPMPPLSWQGYGGSARPTYSSWREWYHRNVGQR